MYHLQFNVVFSVKFGQLSLAKNPVTLSVVTKYFAIIQPRLITDCQDNTDFSTSCFYNFVPFLR